MIRTLLSILALACCVQPAQAQSQKYPSRAVRLIVPGPTMARVSTVPATFGAGRPGA